MTRQEYNRKIVESLSQQVERHPQQRFGQLLVNLGILEYRPGAEMVDPFYEEPAETFSRMSTVV
ncbi:MAG: hypothetical protein WC965_01490 [Thiohalomonadaceae bacterium]